jgi:hypothetical protein
MLIDLDEAVKECLECIGLNVSVGTFGRPYKVPNSRHDERHFIEKNYHLPNIHEQEIILINVGDTEHGDASVQSTSSTLLDGGFFALARDQLVNPRTLAMIGHRDIIDRLLESSGGVVVAFLTQRYVDELHYYKWNSYEGKLDFERTANISNWSFTNSLNEESLEFDYEQGYEIHLSDPKLVISRVLSKHLHNAEFAFTLNPKGYALSFDGKSSLPVFLPLLRNKYNSIVGGIAVWRESGGTLILLPHFSDTAGLVYDLFTDFLPAYLPHLFPEHGGGAWVHLAEYEHPTIQSLQTRIEAIQNEADKLKADLEVQIEAERSRLSFLHGLLIKTGQDLVSDVVAALKHCGFQDVVNVDEGLDTKANLEEDIWIRDRSPALLIEVKGLGGLPSEGDTHQVTKYLNRRKTEWNRTDIQGVFLVNHQLGIPPLERNHRSVFTDIQIEDATRDKVGLMSTWDLFRLIRGMERWNWPNEAVKDVLYLHGRTALVPSHWKLIGKVAHFYDRISVVAVDLTGSEKVSLGATIGYAFQDRFEQETIESLEIDNHRVELANPGQRVGYKTRFARNRLPDNTLVYMVTNPPPS